MASDQALFHTLGERSGDVGLEGLEVVGVDLVGETQGGIDNLRVNVDKEALSERAGTGILAVETREGHGGLAVEVLLEVDGALREDGALILSQCGVEFGGQWVLQHETRQDVAVGRNSQELGGSRVDVGGVEAAGLEEDAGKRNASARQEREVDSVGEVDLAASPGGDARVGRRVEIKLEIDHASIKVLLDRLEPLEGRWGVEQLRHQSRVAGERLVGLGIGVAQDAAGRGWSACAFDAGDEASGLWTGNGTPGLGQGIWNSSAGQRTGDTDAGEGRCRDGSGEGSDEDGLGEHFEYWICESTVVVEKSE